VAVWPYLLCKFRGSLFPSIYVVLAACKEKTSLLWCVVGAEVHVLWVNEVCGEVMESNRNLCCSLFAPSHLMDVMSTSFDRYFLRPRSTCLIIIQETCQVRWKSQPASSRWSVLLRESDSLTLTLRDSRSALSHAIWKPLQLHPTLRHHTLYTQSHRLATCKSRPLSLNNRQAGT
jgi:hypothetical protein